MTENRKFTNYEKCINHLFSLEPRGIKYDLKNIRYILKFLGNPYNKLKCIHIAGTNGKGSVASMLNSVLMECGYKTGLYTSPHFLDFRERIRINGKMISRKFVLDFYNRIIDFQKKKYFSFFEITTALAFEYFHKSNVDIAVIETGLGGRLDSTNVITPILSIITSISLDHTNYLGDTIEKIAFEKAGIIKKNIPCVIGKLNRKAKKVIKKIAGEKKSSLLVTKIYPDLSGLQRSNGKNYPNINLSTILTALDYLNKSGKMKINDSGITRGLKKFKSNSGFFGRFEIFSKNPYTILDVSHNLEAIKNIENNLKSLVIRRSEPQLSNVKLSSTLVTTLQRSNEMKLYIIFAIMSDKDYKSSIKELEKLNAEIIYTKANINRSINPVILYQYTKNKNRAYIAQNIKKAYEFVLNKINKNDILLITGSFYLVSDFLKMKRIKTINDLIK